MKTLELLAPAKDLNAAKAAMNAGADALYMGGPAYSARSNSHNSIEDISQAVEYAHIFSAKVYIALNTLLYDDELPRVEKLIIELYERGVDALIIQDMGILKLDLPPIRLFASTQCFINTPEKARFLQDVGFERLILERSLSLEEIRAIRQATSVELEAFVHGAICISNSGQCYLSYGLGGRSSNRGECAQPCRLPYQLLDKHHNPIAHPRFWLSPKDMNQSENLEALVDAGITSFKIEGRQKDITYVTNVVAFYRQKLDAIIQKHRFHKASLGEIEFPFTPNLAKSFNRGMTSYWLHGKSSVQESVLSLFSQKSIGEFVGKITFANKKFFILDREHDLAAGDGICFFDERKILRGTRINSVRDGKIFPDVGTFLRKNSIIYRNHDEKFSCFLQSHLPKRYIPLTILVKETPHGVHLSATDPSGITTSCDFPLDKQQAENPTMAIERFTTHLSRLGNTPYLAKTILFQWDAPLFVPPSLLNQWRRTLIEQLHDQRMKSYRREEKIHHLPSALEISLPQKIYDFSLNVLNEKAKELYESYGFTILEKAAESGIDLTGRKVMATPTCLWLELGLCEKYTYPAQKIPKPLLEPFYLATRHTLLRLDRDCHQCEMHVYLVSHKKP